MAQPALFIDRDGTLIVNRHYLVDPELVELLPGAAELVRLAKRNEFLVIVISNQSGVARGLMSLEDVGRVNDRLSDLCPGIDAKLFCPHGPDDNCNCRKPKLGLLEEARRVFEVDLDNSLMVGDSAGDIEFGRSAGLSTVLVRTGYGSETERTIGVEGVLVVDGLDDPLLTSMLSR